VASSNALVVTAASSTPSGGEEVESLREASEGREGRETTRVVGSIERF
jgi:hypothetical protein